MLRRFFRSCNVAFFVVFHPIYWFTTSYGQTIPIDVSLLNEVAASAQNERLAKAAVSGDIDALYEIAKYRLDSTISKKKSSGTVDDPSIEILHALADNDIKPHILSQVALGFFYYESGDNDKSLNYFIRAGESGPQQAALYNAGRILAEKANWVPALAYMQGAITLQQTHPKHVQSKLTETCVQAYEVLSENIAFQDEAELLTIEQIADLFLYASMNDFPNDNIEAAEFWKSAVLSLNDFNRTINDSSKVNIEQLVRAAASLRKVWETGSHLMSKLQAFMLLKCINRVFGLLTAFDDAYLEVAAGYAEALALSPFCSGMAASNDKDQFNCFNQAVANAIMYYRRAGDMDGAKRIFEYANQHPVAATSWKSPLQLPALYSVEVSNHPWHKPDEFSSLMEALLSVKSMIVNELQVVKSLPEKPLSVTGFRKSIQSHRKVNEMEVSGMGDVKKGGEHQGFQPLITPHTRSAKSVVGRSEFGPLFNGVVWNQLLCQKTPVLCQTMKKVQSKIINLKIVRMRPGSTILPHCGVTNTQLMFYYCMEGCHGVEVTVAGTTVKNFNGGDVKGEGSSKNMIVFDNSFEHSLVHNGPDDCYFLSVTLSIR